jgi:uncharacterized protein (TIGR02145 family)
MNSYYCVVSNTYGSVTSNITEVAAGCGAKATDGGWLKFMCHNLGASPVGANQSLDAITFAFTTADDKAKNDDAKGWLFQWGRKDDGHQLRGSAAVEGPVSLTGAADQTPSGEDAAKFVTTNDNATFWDWRTPQSDYLWRNWNDNRFPCPAGWKVPSSFDWGALYRSGSTYGTPDQATANTWFWENAGYAIRPDGATTTLFLPAAGFRFNTSAVLYYVGTNGTYWSSTTASSGAYYLEFTSARVSPETISTRANGLSVRCVAE